MKNKTVGGGVDELKKKEHTLKRTHSTLIFLIFGYWHGNLFPSMVKLAQLYV